MLKKIGGNIVLVLGSFFLFAGIYSLMSNLLYNDAKYDLGAILSCFILGIPFIYFGSFLIDIMRIKKIAGIALTVVGGLVLFTVIIYFEIESGESGYDNRIFIIFLQSFIGLLLLGTGIAVIISQKKDNSKTNQLAKGYKGQQQYEYESVKIGNQEWMTKNLDVQQFQNGDPILEPKTRDEYDQIFTEGNPAWCYYRNNPKNGEKYGKLYNWYAVSDPRGLAPKGWHVPSDAEWTQLTEFLGDTTENGIHLGSSAGKMKSKDGWKRSCNGNNESGFSGLPGGRRDMPNGYNFNIYRDFKYLGYSGFWWSSTEKDSGQAWHRHLYYNFNMLERHWGYKFFYQSVRCIKD